MIVVRKCILKREEYIVIKKIKDELNDLIHNSPERLPRETMDGLKQVLSDVEKLEQELNEYIKYSP